MKKRKYMCGALPSPRDSRDWAVRVMAAVFPARLLLGGKPSDQGEYGTCVMQVIRRITSRFWGVATSLFIPYGRWRSHPLDGMYPNEAYNGLVTEGISTPDEVPEKPYEMPKAAEQAAAKADSFVKYAAPRKGGSWHRLHTEAEIKAAIMQIKALKDKGIDGGGVGFCFAVGGYTPDEFGVWHKFIPGTGTLAGLHWMEIDGWEPHPTWPHGRDEELVKVINSWGEDWGEKGYCWISWDDVLSQDDIIVYLPPYEASPNDPIERRRTLRKGMTGEDVREMQQRLIELGYDLSPYGADGDFGGRTQTAVKAFQAANGLEADGVCGPLTWAALDKDVPEPGEDNPRDKPSEPAMGLVRWCHDKTGNPYLWGGNGQVNPTEATIRSMDPDGYKRVLKFIAALTSAGVTRYECYDCSGLISSYLQSIGIVARKQNCDHLWAMCKPISREALIPGDLLFRGKDNDKTHVSVYAGDGWAIHARGRDDGVVKEPISANGAGYWKYCGRLRPLYEEE